MREGLAPATFSIDATTPDEVFPGFHDPAVRWNGWACPGFTRPVAERITAWVNTGAEPDATPLRWDGDVLIWTDQNYSDDSDYEPERLEPDPDGLYWIGAWSWTWESSDPEDLPTRRTFLDLSTRVLPEPEMRHIDQAPVTVVTHQHGAWVHVPPAEPDDDQLQAIVDQPNWQQFPHLRQVLLAARALDAWWVNLDGDGLDIFPHLPTFAW